ncbi:MAG: sulfur carrier protein ThiS [Planctomycetes bacterium]|nr:sulfur carrier protein ThiS [Planctomycetota bacterium]
MQDHATNTIRLSVNGEAREFAAPLSVRALLRELALPTERLAVELNRELLPRTGFDHVLHEGDALEIVTFVGGG